MNVLQVYAQKLSSFQYQLQSWACVFFHTQCFMQITWDLPHKLSELKLLPKSKCRPFPSFPVLYPSAPIFVLTLCGRAQTACSQMELDISSSKLCLLSWFFFSCFSSFVSILVQITLCSWNSQVFSLQPFVFLILSTSPF